MPRSMVAKRVRPQPKTPLGRIFANTVWLLGGKGFGAICGIAYLAILTRTLGLKGFGHFALLFGTAQALVAIAGFQTWRVVVRYGADHVHEGRWDRFGRLALLCGAVDALGAVIGCAIAYIAFYGFGDALGINPEFVEIGFWFNVAMLMALVSAPTGVVRGLDRFDMAVYVEAVVPVGRLLAAIAIWWTGPTVGKFLAAWAAVDLLEAVLYWAMARKLCPEAIRLRHLGGWRRALRENPGIERFTLLNYAGASLEAIARQGPLLAVGAIVGTRAAGLYRLANQVTQTLSKLSSLLARSVYAEISRARVMNGAAEFRKLVAQTSKMAAIAGAVVVTIAALFGEPLLGLLGGSEFERGAAILIPLAIAASFDLASVAFEPVLHSTGRARYALVSRLLSVALLGGAMWLLIDRGAEGAAWAVTVGSLANYMAMGLMARRALREIAWIETGGIGAATPANRTSRPPELEDWLNRHLYHPLSWQVAKLLSPTAITPNMVSIAGGACVVAAGVSYVFLPWPGGAMLGLLLHMSWHVLDGADGDLARMTGKSSPQGEMIDGMCDYLSHATLYVLLAWFLQQQIGWVAWPVAVASGIAHALQSNHVEAQRRFYQSWVYGKAWLIDTGASSAASSRSFAGALTALYLRIAAGFSPAALTLDVQVRDAGHDATRLAEIRAVVRRRWKPLLRLEQLLGPNPRALLLGLSMIVGGSPGWYFATVLVSGVLMLVSIQRHNAAARDVLREIAPISG